MRVLPLIVALMASSLSSTVLAQTPDLERRVDTIEKKLDALFELMQSQSGQPAPARPSAAQAAGAVNQSDDGAVPEGYEPGMYLDVYATGITLNDSNSDQPIPDTYPSGSVKIPPMNTFPYGEILKHQELKDFANMGNSLAGVKYSGQLIIPKTGRHTFQLKLTIDGSQSHYCISSFYMNENRQINLKNNRSMMTNEHSTIELYEGIYDYAIYTLCTIRGNDPRASEVYFNRIRSDLLMAGPSDRAPKPIPTSNFILKY
jgi:hypothetical protein